METEARRQVGAGGQAVDGSLHLGGLILTNLGAHGCSTVGVKGEKRCRLVSEAEVVSKVVTGKEVGGWLELGEGVSLGLVHPNTV